MSLTEKQQKYVLDKCDSVSTEKMARKLGIDKSEIESFLKNLNTAADVAPRPFGEGWMFWIILTVLAIFPQLYGSAFYDFGNDQGVIRQVVMQSVVAVLWILFLSGRLVINKSFIIPRGWGILLSLLLPVWMLVSLLWATNIYSDSMQLISYFSGAGLFTLLCCLRPTKQQLRIGMYVMFCSGLWTSIIGIAQYYDYDFLYALSIPQAIIPAATFGNRNLAAHFVAAMLPLGIAALCGLRSKKELVLLPLIIAGITVDLCFLKFATSAGAIAGVLTGFGGCVLMLLLVACGRCSKKIQIGIATIVIGVIVAGGLYLAISPYVVAKEQSKKYHSEFAPAFFKNMNLHVSSMMGGFLNPQSLEDRAKMYANTLAMINDYPVLGVGHGSHSIKYPLYYYKWLPDYDFSSNRQLENVHNDLLQFIAETGLIGFIILTCFIVCWIVALKRLIATGENFYQKLLLCGAAYPVFAYAGISMFSFPFQRPVPVFVVVFMAGLTYAISLKKKIDQNTEEKRELNLGAKLTTVAALASVAAGMYMIHSSWILMNKDEYTGKVLYYSQFERWDMVENEIPQVMKFAANDRDALMICAMSKMYLLKAQQGAEMVDRLVKLYPNYTSGLGNAGVIYETIKDYKKSVKAFYHAAKILPHDKEINRGLIKVLNHENKWAEHADIVLTNQQISKLLENTGRKEEALKKSDSKFADFYLRDLQNERKRLIYKLLIACDYNIKTDGMNDFIEVIRTGLKINPGWYDLHGIYGWSLININKGDEGLKSIAGVFNRMDNEVLRTSCLNALGLADTLTKDKKLAAKYKELAVKHIQNLFRISLYDNLGGALSEIKDLDGILMVTEEVGQRWGFPKEYLSFIMNPVALADNSKLSICANPDCITPDRNIYFLDVSAPYMERSRKYLENKYKKSIRYTMPAEYDSNEIIKWNGLVVLAGSWNIGKALDSKVISKLRSSGSKLGNIGVSVGKYNFLAFVNYGKLLYEDSDSTRQIEFKKDMGNDKLQKELAKINLSINLPAANSRYPASAVINGKNYNWSNGIRAFFFNTDGKLVKYRTFVSKNGLSVSSPFKLYKVIFQ